MTEAKKEALDSFLSLATSLGSVSEKAMFGGYGVFCEGLMFALITRQGELYLKADDENRPAFEKADLGKYGRMPYFKAPEKALRDWPLLKPWAEGAVEAARRAGK